METLADIAAWFTTVWRRSHPHGFPAAAIEEGCALPVTPPPTAHAAVAASSSLRQSGRVTAQLWIGEYATARTELAQAIDLADPRLRADTLDDAAAVLYPLMSGSRCVRRRSGRPRYLTANTAHVSVADAALACP